MLHPFVAKNKNSTHLSYLLIMARVILDTHRLLYYIIIVVT